MHLTNTFVLKIEEYPGNPECHHQIFAIPSSAQHVSRCDKSRGNDRDHLSDNELSPWPIYCVVFYKGISLGDRIWGDTIALGYSHMAMCLREEMLCLICSHHSFIC